MTLTLGVVSTRKGTGKSAPADALTQDYLTRASRYIPTTLQTFPSETTLLAACERDSSQRPARPARMLILFDSRGESATSEQFAAHLRRYRENAQSSVMFAIGPADGWSPTALAKAAQTISFGRMTLPHELARVLASEQIYRALTIIAGHPYHIGH